MSTTAAPSIETTAWAAEAYERYAPEVRAYVLGRFRGRVTPEDVVQEAFVRLVREAREDRAPVQVRAWLYRVAHNLAVSELRRPAQRQPEPDSASEVEAQTASAEQVFELGDVGPELRDAMRRLSPDGRVGLLMAAEGYSGREIARAVGRSELATRAMLCRARRSLRTALAGGRSDPSTRLAA